MRIGINTRFLLKDKMEGFGWYTYEICRRIVQTHPEHEFVFFFDRSYHPDFLFGKNVTPVVLSPPARHPLLFILWFDWALPSALKKHNIDVFFSPDGYLSLRTKIPQIATIHDINFEHYPEDIPRMPRLYLRHFFPKFAKKAKHIITVSEYSKKDLVETYDVPKEKITAIWNGASDQFTPLASQKQAVIRRQESQGNPYFLFVGSLHPRKNLSRLLAAYNLYLERNPDSPYDLMIVGAALWKEENFTKQLDEKTKQRIHFKGHLPLSQLTKIVASAHVFIYVPYFEGFGIPLVEAMQCGVPILSGNLTSLPEVAGDAALYCDPFSVEDIAAKLAYLAQDEETRADLSAKGKQRAILFSWDIAADQVWDVLFTK